MTSTTAAGFAGGRAVTASTGSGSVRCRPRRSAGAPRGHGSGRRWRPRYARPAARTARPTTSWVSAVGDPRVDADHERRVRFGHQVEQLVPAGRVLGQHQPRPHVAEGPHREAPRHLQHRTPWRPAPRAVDTQASAATAAIKALAWLKRPGSASRTGADRPSAHSARAVTSAPRRASPRGRDGRSRSRRRTSPIGKGDAAPARGTTHGIVLPAQAGTDPVHVAGGAGPPHHERDRRRSPPHVCAVPPPAPPASSRRSCAPRSSGRADRGRGSAAPPWPPPSRSGRGAGRSRRSRARRGAASVPTSAATCPGGMLEPVSLLTTASPSTPSPTVSNLVVVVFPLVPVTSAIWRPALRCSSSRGSSRRPARPPATVPWPRPRRRDVALTTRVVALASRALTEEACCGPAPRRSARGAPCPQAAAGH